MSRCKFLVLTLLFFLVQTANALNSNALLSPEQAFRATAQVNGANQLEIQWLIAKGYSLYRKNMRFVSNTSGLVLDVPAIPTGKIKHDDMLGDIEHFRDNLTIKMPVKYPADLTEAQLTVHYQGCADSVGVCFPPQELKMTIKLPVPVVVADVGPIDNLVKGIANFKSGSTLPELLPPDQAFQFIASLKDNNTLHVSWVAAEDYYLYREKFKLELVDSGKVKLGSYTLPHGTPKEDEAFGKVEIFHGEISLDVPLIRTDNAPQVIRLKAFYQGCADRGVCYPPMDKTVSLDLPDAVAITTPAKNDADTLGLETSEQDQFTNTLKNKSFGVTLLAFLGAGLLLSFTPCVFPMIPILSGIIVGKGKNITASRGFWLSFCYVVASAAMYTVFGIIAALFGSNLQATFQQPWIIALFSAVFILLSLSMFGFYSLELPDFIRAKLHNSSEKHRDGSMLGAAIMGALSALIVGPCVAAPLVGALVYIGQTGDTVLGGSALFILGMGMGAPLIIMGASAGKLLPKAGAWLNATNAVFGVLMLAVAVWMLSRILPPEITMLLWALLLILPAIYLNAIDPLPEHSSGWRKLWKGVGITMLAYGLLLLIGFSVGNSNPLKPLHGFGLASVKTTNEDIRFERIASVAELENKIRQASANNQPVMLDFYADWCISCKEMEAYTFTDATVKRTLAGFMLLQADVTQNSDDDKALLAKFKLFGPPAILFFNNGKENSAHRVIGYQETPIFLNTLSTVTQCNKQPLTC